MGTGVIRPFLDMQQNPSEQGFNTDNDDFVYDQHRTTDTNALPLNYLPVFPGPMEYGDVREFVLDAHESDNLFDISEFEVYVCTTDAARTYSERSDFEDNTTDCHLVYTIAEPINATDQFSSGSGNVFDYRILIPNKKFEDALSGTTLCTYDPSAEAEAACHQYVIVWAKMDNTGSTFEEFSTILRPAIKIAKTPDAADAAAVDAGNDITFTMAVSSSGSGTATGVELSDPLPMGPSGNEVDWYTYTTTAGTCSIAGDSPDQQTLSCTLGDLAQGSTITVTVTAHTTQSSCDVYDNTATVTSTNAGSTSDPGQITVGNCPGTIELKKVWVGTGGQTTLNIGTTSGGGDVATQETGAAGGEPLGTGAQTVDAGTYYVSETGGLDGYTPSLACTDNDETVEPGENNALSVAAGHAVICTFTNTEKPAKLTVVKIVKGAPAGFDFTGEGAGVDGSFTLTPSITDGSAQVVYSTLSAGTYSITEVPNSEYTLTDLGCSDQAAGAYDPQVTRTVSVDLPAGGDVTCTFINQQNSETTRTQGFWATHKSLTEAVWFGGTAGGHTFSGLSESDQTLCGRQLTTIDEVLGGFWASIAKTTDNGKRSQLDQARMQLLQQLLASILNHAAFGSSPTAMSIADAKDAFCGTDVSAIRTAQSAMASFNTSGDNGTFTPGVSANGKKSKDAADLAFWDVLP
ncbi:MAG: hypothetical protein PVJ02_14265 [Gemmatimonadota bacterium]